jgi:hypothetical protein
MAETPTATPANPPIPNDNPSPAASAPAAPAPLKKGSLVRVSQAAYLGSTEAAASDPTPPNYIFEGPGEILALKGDYAQLRWRRPVPDVWLRLDQLEAC